MYGTVEGEKRLTKEKGIEKGLDKLGTKFGLPLLVLS